MIVRAARAAVLLVVAIVLVLVAWPEDEDTIGSPASPPYLTIFMVDGLSQAVFEEELAKGNLPNLRALIDEGAYVEDGVAAFPSMTGYGYYPFLTGVDAAESGVLGLRWFDRSRATGVFRTYVGRTNVELNGDLSAEPETLFELAGDAHSLSINSYADRGARRSIRTDFEFVAAKYEGHWWFADLLSSIPPFEDELSPDWRQIERQVVELALADLVHRPKVQWITFVSPDAYVHVNGVGPKYPELVRSIDEMIGVYRDRAAKLGIDDDRIYAFVSDHGVETVTRSVDLRATMKNVALRAFRGEATEVFRSRMNDTFETFAPYDVVLAINGNLMTYVYVKGASGWGERPSLPEMRRMNLVDALLGTEGVEHVIARGESGVEVLSREGRGIITATDGGFAYRFEGKDPLGYYLDPSERTAAEWMEATHDSAYPYAVVRIARLMAEEAAGDLVVTGAPTYDLAPGYEMFVGTYRGGHGGLRRAQIVVPLILAGPGVKHTQVDAMPVEHFGDGMIRLLTGSSLNGRRSDLALDRDRLVDGDGHR